MFPCDMSIFNFSFFISFGFQGKSLVLIELILGHSLSFPFNKNWMANFSHIFVCFSSSCNLCHIQEQHILVKIVLK